ncbi:MAG: hypothetical protein GY832_25775 [Chloroflexi bacterium]|nr:hypothetical protein [Chloroflexota bacterium]
MIYTVNGPIKKEDLGLTLSHEHTTWDSSQAEALYSEKRYDEEIVRTYTDTLLPVFTRLAKAGCRAIVEASPPEGGQNLRLLKTVSTASGMHIVPNTGSFFGEDAFPSFKDATIDAIAAQWIGDFNLGLDTLDGVVIRPGYLKIALNDDGAIAPLREKLFRAAVRTSNATGLPIQCHILRAATAEQALAILREEQCDLSKFLWAHACNEADIDVIQKLASQGIWLGIDCIRKGEYDKYPALIKQIIALGYQDQMLLSQDYDFFAEITQLGPEHPCASILTDFVPYCEANGLDRDVLLSILTDNPGNFFDIQSH